MSPPAQSLGVILALYLAIANWHLATYPNQVLTFTCAHLHDSNENMFCDARFPSRLLPSCCTALHTMARQLFHNSARECDPGLGESRQHFYLIWKRGRTSDHGLQTSIFDTPQADDILSFSGKFSFLFGQVSLWLEFRCANLGIRMDCAQKRLCSFFGGNRSQSSSQPASRSTAELHFTLSL